MRGLLAAFALACALPVSAQTLPAFYSVSGVAADDVLNVRARPDAGAVIVGSLPPDATGVEVVGLSGDGNWAQVNVDETAGWVAVRFLARQPGPDWTALQSPLACAGTEPFWALTLDPATGAASFDEPGWGERPVEIRWATMVSGGAPVAGVYLDSHGAPAFAVIASGICRDGMSDRVMGLAVNFFVTSETGDEGYSGCCRLAP